MDRRSFVAAAAAALAIRPSLAQATYPDHAITIINPFPPGGATEVVTRPLAAVLKTIVKQPVVIETKAGAAGQVGAQFAASAKPDGYTLLVHIVSISGFSEVDRLYGRPVKFTRDDFIPIARFIADPMVLVVNDKQPYKNLKDFIDDVKKRPNELVFSSSGLHGALHLPTALFLKAAGLQMRHLPTQGGGPAVTAGPPPWVGRWRIWMPAAFMKSAVGRFSAPCIPEELNTSSFGRFFTSSMNSLSVL